MWSPLYGWTRDTDFEIALQVHVYIVARCLATYPYFPCSEAWEDWLN